MTRIMCWNIDNFNLLKIQNPQSMNLEVPYYVPEAVASTARENYIIGNFGFTDPVPNQLVRPDIIVVIEVSTADTFGANAGIGQLASGLGGQGAFQLLGRIRAVTGNASWMLVPPLQTGPQEAVAVYYDSSNYCFVGPWFWPGGNGPSRNAAAPADYPQPFRDGLPDTDIPAGLPNAGVSERKVAAATGFTYRVGHAQAGQPINYAANVRTPYWVKLAEVNYGQNPPVVGRTFSLFAIHGPAGNALALGYLTGLADVAEIVAAPAVNEVKVVLGDFNLNLTVEQAPPPVIVQAPAYAGLTAAGYTLAFSSPGQVPSGNANFTGYRGYLATHVRTLGNATYWYIGNNSDFYPGFGYVGSDTATRNYSLDNILVRFGLDGHGAPCGILANATVLNGVVSSPFAAYVPPHNAPQGTYGWPLQMGTVADYNAPPQQIMGPNDPNDARRASFPQWDNFGHIRCTSDHMAIVASV